MSTAEERFLAFVRDRDQRAIESLIDEHLAPSRAHAMRLLRNAADADDAVQDAIARLIATAAKYDGSIPFSAWFRRLVHAASVDRVRDRERRTALTRRHRPPNPSTDRVLSATSPEAVAALRLALSRLADEYRRPLELHYIAGLSHEEVARTLQLTVPATTKRIQRARERLGRDLRRAGVTIGLAAMPSLLRAAITETPAIAAARSAARLRRWSVRAGLAAALVAMLIGMATSLSRPTAGPMPTAAPPTANAEPAAPPVVARIEPPAAPPPAPSAALPEEPTADVPATPAAETIEDVAMATPTPVPVARPIAAPDPLPEPAPEVPVAAAPAEVRVLGDPRIVLSAAGKGSIDSWLSFRQHVINASDATLTYEIFANGISRRVGKVEPRAGEQTENAWRVAPGRYEVRIVLDPQDRIVEDSSDNESLIVVDVPTATTPAARAGTNAAFGYTPYLTYVPLPEQNRQGGQEWSCLVSMPLRNTGSTELTALVVATSGDHASVSDGTGRYAPGDEKLIAVGRGAASMTRLRIRVALDPTNALAEIDEGDNAVDLDVVTPATPGPRHR